MNEGNDRKIHSHHEQLTGEHPRGDMGQLIFLAIFGGALLLDFTVLHLSEMYRGDIDTWVRLPPATLFFIGGYMLIRKTHKTVFGEERNEPVLLTEGPFRRIRHPMYTGIILMYIGGLIFSLSIVALPVFIGALFFYRFIARYEEKLLEQKFGKEYSEYKETTGMFLPRMGKKIRER